MSAQSPSAWFLSISLHVFVAGLIAFVAYTASLEPKKQPVILELVAGEGDNYMATEAPALGSQGGVTVSLPEIPEPRPAPPEPQAAPPPVVQEPSPPLVEPEPPPIAPAPQPKASPPKAPPPKSQAKKAPNAVPDFEKQLRWNLIKGESLGKLRAKKEREAEAKRKAAEKKRLEEEDRKMSKAEFDAKYKSSTKKSTTKASPVKIAKIDAKGIAAGVAGGSTNNTKGGARGTALTSDTADRMAAYFAFFRDELRRTFEPPPGLSDTLKVSVRVRVFANGRLGTPKVIGTSGSREYDRAVLDAIEKLKLGPRPDRLDEDIDFTFTMREANE